MEGAVNIARCPVHGMHGEREECFVCGVPVEQVPMVPCDDAAIERAARAERERDELKAEVDRLRQECDRWREWAGIGETP